MKEIRAAWMRPERTGGRGLAGMPGRRQPRQRSEPGATPPRSGTDQEPGGTTQSDRPAGDPTPPPRTSGGQEPRPEGVRGRPGPAPDSPGRVLPDGAWPSDAARDAPPPRMLGGGGRAAEREPTPGHRRRWGPCLVLQACPLPDRCDEALGGVGPPPRSLPRSASTRASRVSAFPLAERSPKGKRIG